MPDPDVRANTDPATIGPGQYSGATGDYFRDNQLVSGEAVMPREVSLGNVTMTSGSLRFGFFTARKTETITVLRVSVGSTAAGATPTLIRYGIYTVAADGALTLVAATPNDTGLLAVAGTPYPKALSAPWSKQAGLRYAAGIIVVTATTAPSVVGSTPPGPGTDTALAPRLSGVMTGQTDLPTSIPGASVGDSTNRIQMIFVV